MYKWIFFMIAFATSATMNSCISQNMELTIESEYVRIFGRYAEYGATAEFSYPGVSIELLADAKRIEVTLTDSTLLDKLGRIQHDRFNVIIDDKIVSVLTLKEGMHTYLLAENLPKGKHSVELVKLSEAVVGTVTFHSFTMESVADIQQPPLLSRNIEFIGNSITCGYGIETDKPEETFSYATENVYSAYAMQAARMLNAKAHLVAYSGKGISRNWVDTVLFQETMLELYDRCLPADTASEWDCARYTPQTVVINLGTNDFSPPLGAEKVHFIPRYTKLIEKIRENYGPYVHIFCLNGPMLTGANRVYLENWLMEIVENQKDSHLHYFALSECRLKDGRGADYHPSQKTADRNAKELSDELKRVLNW